MRPTINEVFAGIFVLVLILGALIRVAVDIFRATF